MRLLLWWTTVSSIDGALLERLSLRSLPGCDVRSLAQVLCDAADRTVDIFVPACRKRYHRNPANSEPCPALLAVCAHIAAVVTPELLPSVFFHLLGKRMRSHDNAERHLVVVVGFR